MRQTPWTPDGPEPRDEAAVRELLERAGERPTVPPEDLREIIAAARSSWEQAVDDNRPARAAAAASWSRRLAVAAVLLATVGVVWTLVGRQPVAAPALARVARVERVLGSSSWTAENRDSGELVVGRELHQQDRIETDPNGGGVALELTSGASLRLDAGTEITLLGTDRVRLDRGALYFDGGPPDGRPGGRIVVDTPYGQLTDIGTQFSARLGTESPISAPAPVLTVLVREGLVAIETGDSELEVSAGHGLALAADGSTETIEVSGWGSAWDWVVRRTPVYPLDGRTVREVLDWVGRETGLQIEISAGAEAQLDERIHGSLEGRPLRETALLALSTVSLEGEIDGGVLTVRPR